MLSLVVGTTAAAAALSTTSLSSAVKSAAPSRAYSYKAYDASMSYRELGKSDLLVSSCCMVRGVRDFEPEHALPHAWRVRPRREQLLHGDVRDSKPSPCRSPPSVSSAQMLHGEATPSSPHAQREHWGGVSIGEVRALVRREHVMGCDGCDHW